MPVRERQTVLFVCRHGAAKSVLAAADLRRLAAERQVGILAESAGIDPDLEVSPAVIRALELSDDVVAQSMPRRVTRSQLASAWRVITFNLDPIDLPIVMTDAEPWDDIPPISEDLDGARAAIGRHLEHLIADWWADHAHSNSS